MVPNQFLHLLLVGKAQSLGWCSFARTKWITQRWCSSISYSHMPEYHFVVNQVCQFVHQTTTHCWLPSNAFFVILWELLTMAYNTSLTLSVSLRISTSIMLGILMIVSLQVDIVCILVLILFLGVQRGKIVHLSLALRSSIDNLLWPLLLYHFFRMLFRDLHRPTLFCNSISAISLASNPVFHARTHHVEVDYHYVHEKVVRKEVVVNYVSIHDQISDIFTMGLSINRFRFLVSKLLVLALPVSLRGCDRQ